MNITKIDPINRGDLIDAINAKILNLVELLDSYKLKTLAVRKQNKTLDKQIAKTIKEEKAKQNTISDVWLDLSGFVDELCTGKQCKQISHKLAKIGLETLRRNMLWDGIDFCPMCGEIGEICEHNGAPLMDEQVCERCNKKVVIPARLMMASMEKSEKARITHSTVIRKLNESRTPEERRLAAKRAVMARWNKERKN